MEFSIAHGKAFHFNERPLLMPVILILSWHFSDTKIKDAYAPLLILVIISDIWCSKSAHYKLTFKFI